MTQAAYRTANATVSAHDAKIITPSDTTEIPICRGIWVGVTGHVAVQMASSGSSVTFQNVPVGVLPVQAIKVLSTGTTASALLALY